VDAQTRNGPAGAAARGPLRVLGVFAHPDDETVCAGGTLAKYAAAGAEVRVVSLTKGGAGEIRDADAATRTTLTATRERELQAAASELGLTDARCLDLRDGSLAALDPPVLVELATGLLEELEPDVVLTFGADGFSGHSDHAAVGAAVTAACVARAATVPVRLFHCHRPRSRMLLRDRLAGWVAEMTTRFEGTREFVHALSVFSRETSGLGFAADFVRVEWFPAGTYLMEQGEAATRMFLLLSGRVEIRREDAAGQVRVVDESRPGQFVGEQGIATGRPRNASVVAVDDVTTLTFAAVAPPGIDEPDDDGTDRSTRTLPSGDRIDARVDTCIDVSAFVGPKIRALAAHRSQYPIDPTLFPEHVLQEMFGVEYFVRVLPERPLDASLLDGSCEGRSRSPD
jgi:LmbE family N-acetylglucosaminyl deacetylase